MAKTTTNKKPKEATKKTEPKKTKVTGAKSVDSVSETLESKLFKSIYGDEKPKEVIPFPDADFQTQTKNKIKEYDINVAYLPENIVNAVNDLIRDFTYFVQNKNMMDMISPIMNKDLIALNLLKEWSEPKADLLSQLKKERGIEDNSVVVINNVNQPISSLPSNPNALNQSNISVNAPASLPHMPSISNLRVHDVNPLIPRDPASTYQHTNNSSVFGENKNAHHEMMTAASPSIVANTTAQQNYSASTPEPVDMSRFLENYSKSIIETIKSTFQMLHWGYIPMDVLNEILSKCDKSIKYDVYNNGKDSYLVISDNKESIRTEAFAIN
jgi:hypothetical protein